MRFWRKRRREHLPEEHRERKVGFLKRNWRKLRAVDWKNPVNRWKLVFVSFAAVVFMGLFTYSAIAVTSTPTFCKSCHEMSAEYVTYKATSHSELKCTQCHIPPGAVNLVTHKVAALKELYYHFTDQVPNPIAMKHPLDNETCIQCHSQNRLVTATGDLKPNHSKHIEKEIPCVTCHAGVAHAKVVDRGLNDHDDYDSWTMDAASKLVTDAYTRPNMGTCIDCHEKVNEGKEPWKEEHTAAAEGHEKKEGHEAQATAAAADSGKTQTEQTVQRILRSLGKEQTGEKPKISMECFTCHEEINTPKNHDIQEWNQNHGSFALQELDKCQNCHQEAKWIKEMPEEDIQTLLATTEHKKVYQPNPTEVKSHARASSFCSSCHKDRPPKHLNSDQWLTQHAKVAQDQTKKSLCLTCHDYEKVEKSNAPTDVYCKYCHRTGLKSGAPK